MANDVVARIRAIARRRRVPKSEEKAAYETGRVESNFTNPAGGDADSQGWRQERAGLYKDPRNLDASINRFFDEAAKADHGQKSYQIAADVQRPAAQYRGRYKTAAREAQSLLRGGKGSPPGAPTAVVHGQASAAPDTRRAALQAYVLAQGTRDQPDSLLNLAHGLSDARTAQTPAAPADAKTALRTRRSAAPATTASTHGGTVDFDGKKVAAWIGDALNYARKQGWKGTVNSGFRSDAEQTRIYKSGVRPAAVPKSMGGGGSNHEGTVFPLGAVDVSEAQQLSDILKNSPYGKKLQWAGTKDPVHFSHPHNGSY